MTEETIQTPASLRWLRIALIGSLALNLAVAGVVAGAFFRGPGGGHMQEMAGGDGFRALAWALPAEHRRDLGRELFARRAEFGQTRDQMRAARSVLAAALTTEPFDLSAVEAAFAGQKQILLHIADEGYKVVITRISQMDAGQRAEFAGNLVRRSHR